MEGLDNGFFPEKEAQSYHVLCCQVCLLTRVVRAVVLLRLYLLCIQLLSCALLLF